MTESAFVPYTSITPKEMLELAGALRNNWPKFYKGQCNTGGDGLHSKDYTKFKFNKDGKSLEFKPDDATCLIALRLLNNQNFSDSDNDKKCSDALTRGMDKGTYLPMTFCRSRFESAEQKEVFK